MEYMFLDNRSTKEAVMTAWVEELDETTLEP